jgi:hypothetical protein
LETEGYKAMSNNTTNVLVATRDEIMERLFDKVSNKKNKLELVDVDYTKDT